MNPIDRLRQSADARPEWAHLYALELDQQLLRERAAHLVTVARHGTCSAAPVAAPATDPAATDAPRDTLAQAARLLAAGHRWTAMRHAYDGARGEVIHACNLLYASASAGQESVWLHFLNKYLARFGVAPLTLVPGPQPRIFRLQSAAADEKSVAKPPSSPLVSVLMPAFNASATIEHACRSILNQTWRALELIVVDDASTDNTWQRLQELAREDGRLRPLRLTRNAGPYVAKNFALQQAAGRYVTSHDADDWALPERVERQLQPLLAEPLLKVSVGRMLRMTRSGEVTRFAPVGPLSHDGALRRCYVSPLIERQFFDRHLGAWDGVRFGADSEMLARIERFAPQRLVDLVLPVMLALDTPESLTRQSGSVIDDDGRVNATRADYQRNWQRWHAAHTRMPRLAFPQTKRAFEAPAESIVDPSLQTQPVETGAPAAGDQLKPATRQLEQPAASRAVATNVLWRAARRLPDEDAARVLADAEREAGEVERPAIELLRANLQLDDDAAWLRAVNRYIEQFEVSPLALQPLAKDRFWRIHAATPRTIEQGPLVSVIMPAFDSEASLAFAARSVLAQTWRPLELIIVDDASTDRTAEVAQQLAREDARVKVLHNRANVGPYVSKNFGLQVAQGRYVTGHDADDWAHPERIERQLKALLETGGAMPVNLMGMLRTESSGRFSRISQVTVNSRDGVLQSAFISAFFDADFLKRRLGHWDEARFAGDSEIIGRARRVLGTELMRLHCLGMICLDSPEGLTNHPEHGYSPTQGLSESRRNYREAFAAWHLTIDSRSGQLDFPQGARRFPIPDAARVDPDALRQCVEGHAMARAAKERE
jgi:glycosyltransferase involved in cell wall biosynthesis